MTFLADKHMLVPLACPVHGCQHLHLAINEKKKSQQFCQPHPRHVNTTQCTTSPPSIAVSIPTVHTVSLSPLLYRHSHHYTILHSRINPTWKTGNANPLVPRGGYCRTLLDIKVTFAWLSNRRRRKECVFNLPGAIRTRGGGGLTLVYLDAYLAPCPKGSQGLKDTITYKLSYDVVADSNLFGSDVVATYFYIFRIGSGDFVLLSIFNCSGLVWPNSSPVYSCFLHSSLKNRHAQPGSPKPIICPNKIDKTSSNLLESEM